MRTKATNTSGTRFFEIESLESEQTPNGYCKKVKVSIVPNDAAPGGNYLVLATADNTNYGQQVITGQAVHAGGTVWLDLSRKIVSQSSDDTRNDAAVSIWIKSDIGTTVEALCEVWGRFIDVNVI